MKFIVSALLLFSLNLSAKMLEGGVNYAKPSVELENEDGGVIESYKKKITKWWEKNKPDIFLSKEEKQKKVQKKIVKETKEDLIEKLPVYTSKKKGTSTQEYTKALVNTKNKKIFTINKPSIDADPKLPKYKSGVSYLKNVRVKKIPKINIGREAEISIEDWKIREFESFQQNYQDVVPLPSIANSSESDFKKFLGKPVKLAKNSIDLKIMTLKSLGLSAEKVQAIQYYLIQEKEFPALTYKELSQEELQFLKAMIYFDKGDKCHIAAGLYYPLTKSKKQKIRELAKLHFGVCNHLMGLYSQSTKYLFEASYFDNIDYAKVAYNTLLNDIPESYELEISEHFYKQKRSDFVSEKFLNKYNYFIAKYLAKIKNYKQSLSYASKVSKKSKYWQKATYVSSVASYFLGAKNNAFQQMNQLYTNLKDKNSRDENLFSLLSINLARVSFRNKNYSSAIEKYRQIDKSHPMWLQGLQEQGWTQLQIKDPKGAIGNMHSIHSPYFKSAYKPQSYAIRTIGYLDLCQYPDAYRSLTNLEKIYRGSHASVKKLNRELKSNQDYYKLSQDYILKRKLPKKLSEKVMKEVVRQRKFIALQKSIESLNEEKSQHTYLTNILDKDRKKILWLKRKAIKRAKSWETKIKVSKKKKKFENLVIFRQKRNFERRLAKYYDFQIKTLQDSKKEFQSFSKKLIAEAKPRRKSLQKLAGSQVKKYFVKIENDLKLVIENNEFLRYEVFSGSGENIRFLAAGGKVEKRRIPASIQPKSKDLKFEFEGEFWADEIGYYRSTLKSNCPNRTAAR